MTVIVSIFEKNKIKTVIGGLFVNRYLLFMEDN